MTPHTTATKTNQAYAKKLYKYLSENGAVPGLWGGQATSRFGLCGNASSEPFEKLVCNLHPITNERLTVRNKQTRRVGYDFNFHPPKSVSVVHALTRDARIAEACEEAVDHVMSLMELDAQTRVRIGGQDLNRSTSNLVWVKFFHQTARPVKGKPDPQLHWHCFVFNATYDVTERRWKAAQFGDLKADGAYYQARFHSRLASNLAMLGYEIRPKGGSFELAGVPESLIRKFSNRREQIDAHAAMHNITSKKARSYLGLRTREPKRHELSVEQSETEWRSRLTAEDAALIATYGPPLGHRKERIHIPELVAPALDYARKYSFQRYSVVDERYFLRAAMSFAIERLDPERLLQEIAQEPTLIRRVHRGRNVLTTTTILAEEKQIVEWAREGRGKATPLATDHRFSVSLSEEQQRAARSVLESRDRLTTIIGRAGTGKTTLMKETIAAIRAKGRGVVVLAPHSDAARGTLRKAGFKDSQTVDMLFKSEALQTQARDGVIWIDEAGLLASENMLRVTTLADQLNARVVLSGDTQQHRAVSRGDVFRMLIEHSDVEVSTLTTNRRQRGVYKDAVDHVAENQMHEAFRKLDTAGAIHEIQGPERHDFIAAKYLGFREIDESTQIVCPTHIEGRAVTSAVREALRADGQLSDERAFVQLRRVDLLDADKERSSVYRLGWVVEMMDRAGGHERGARYVVTHLDGNDVYVQFPDGSTRHFDVAGLYSKFNVYERDVLRIGVGDRIRIAQNGLDTSRHLLNNSDIHTVIGFTEGGDIRLENGQVVSDNFAHLAHGYVTTSYVAQGKTVQHVIVAEGAESFPAGNREQFYVSVSRGRISATIVTTDKEGLFETVLRSSQRLSALDLPDEQSSETQPDVPVVQLRTGLGTLRQVPGDIPLPDGFEIAYRPSL